MSPYLVWNGWPAYKSNIVFEESRLSLSGFQTNGLLTLTLTLVR